MSNVLYAVLASVLIINAVLYANVSDNYVPETIILSPHPTLQPTCHPIPHPTARPSRPPAPRPTLSPTPKPTIPPSKPHALSSGASTAWTRSNHAASQPRTSSSSSSSYVRRAFFGLVLVAAAGALLCMACQRTSPGERTSLSEVAMGPIRRSQGYSQI